ncbi:MAG: hypothetical protein HC781_14870 [Leptolyngbyaceae cyanobacterium CSU_1_4]|nr:hypothetical protein [Leptolyngbyaceae cyanobacterium CSU_1_4]
MQQKPIFRRGNVVLVAFPNSNLTTAKTRPALVVQADNLETVNFMSFVLSLMDRNFKL